MTINLARSIAPIISSRDVIAKLSKRLSSIEAHNVRLSFADVEFLSRSAAHELLILQGSLREKKTVEFIDLNADVLRMLEVVKKTSARKERPLPKLRVDRTSIKTLIKAF